MILVTGGLGLVGTHVVQSLLDLDQDVLATFHNARREPEAWTSTYKNRVQVERLDTTNAHQMFALGRGRQITGIMHLAVPPLNASTSSEEYRINTTSLYNVLEAGRLWGVKRVVLASSVAIYGSLGGQGPFTEDMRLPIESGTTTEAYKKAEETMSLFYGDQNGLGVACARISQQYGPLYDKAARLPTGLMTTIMRACRAAAQGQPLEIHLGPRDQVAGDITYVRDTATAMALLAVADELPHRIYNCGIGALTTIDQLVDAIKGQHPGAHVSVVDDGRLPPAALGYMDSQRIRDDVGFVPQYLPEAGVADYVEWLGSQPE